MNIEVKKVKIFRLNFFHKTTLLNLNKMEFNVYIYKDIIEAKTHLRLCKFTNLYISELYKDENNMVITSK